MIFYFTGTGNSRYIAKQIAAVTGETIVSINDKIKAGDTAPIETDGRVVFVTPTYAWRIPRIVENWIRAVEFDGADKAWFVMDCGSEIGNAAAYNARLCADKGFAYMGTAQIVMPENYIAMFRAPDEDEAREIIAKAGPVIGKTAAELKAGAPFAKPRKNVYDRFMSGPVNPLFYRFTVKANAFTADQACIGCGKCAALCPLNNIRLEHGKPVWGKSCTHCMACIAYCPAKAIEYGKKSVGKPRYHLEEPGTEGGK